MFLSALLSNNARENNAEFSKMRVGTLRNIKPFSSEEYLSGIFYSVTKMGDNFQRFSYYFVFLDKKTSKVKY